MKVSKRTHFVCLLGLMLPHSVPAVAHLDYFARVSPEGSQIVFYSNRTGSWKLYSVDEEGGELTALTVGPGNDYDPSWSTDGARILFSSDRDGQRDIYSVNKDGSGLARLTRDAREEKSLATSPVGNKIGFFTADKSNAPKAHYLIVADYEGRETKRFGPYREPYGRMGFSPDAKRVAFFEIWPDESANAGVVLHILNIETGSDAVVSHAFAEAGNPQFSPDGKWLSFDANTSTADFGPAQWEIWRRTLDGTRYEQITLSPTASWGATWFPDGKHLLFIRGIHMGAPGDYYDVYRVAVDGSNVRQLTHHNADPGKKGEK